MEHSILIETLSLIFLFALAAFIIYNIRIKTKLQNAHEQISQLERRVAELDQEKANLLEHWQAEQKHFQDLHKGITHGSHEITLPIVDIKATHYITEPIFHSYNREELLRHARVGLTHLLARQIATILLDEDKASQLIEFNLDSSRSPKTYMAAKARVAFIDKNYQNEQFTYATYFTP